MYIISPSVDAIELKEIYILLFDMLINNLQSDFESVHGMWRYAYEKFPL